MVLPCERRHHLARTVAIGACSPSPDSDISKAGGASGASRVNGFSGVNIPLPGRALHGVLAERYGGGTGTDTAAHENVTGMRYNEDTARVAGVADFPKP
jgi:hypothetical protein